MALYLCLVFFNIQDVFAQQYAILDKPVPIDCEYVMEPNTKIIAKSPLGTIEIVSGNGLKRSYTWDGQTRSVEMWPRQELWMGNKGMYFPGLGEHWQSVNGITRGVVQEGRLNFDSVEEAVNWLAHHNASKYKPYRSDGLCVWWSMTPARRQLNVDVLQILVKNEKPQSLPGADDAYIAIEPATSTTQGK